MFLNTHKISSFSKLFLKEFSFQFSENILRIIGGIIIISRLSKHLGVEQYGSLIFIESSFVLLLGLSQFGMSPSMIKSFTQKKSNYERYIFNGLLLSVLISLIWFIIFNIWNFTFLDFKNKELLMCASFVILFNPILFAEYYLNSKNKLRVVSTVRAASYLLIFILKIIAIKLNAPFQYFVYLLMLEFLIIYFIYFLLIPNKLKFLKKGEINLKDQSLILIEASLIFLYGLGTNIFSRIDIFMIQKYLNNIDLGNYSASFKIVSFVYVFPIIISNIFFPRILLLTNKDSSSLKKIYFISFWISIIIFLILFLFRKIIIDSVFDKDLYNIHEIFTISSLAIIFIGLSSTYVKVLYRESLQKLLFYRSLIGITLNILLNFILIPNYGIMGVCYATVISIFYVEIINDFFIKKLRKHHLIKLTSIFHYEFLLFRK